MMEVGVVRIGFRGRTEKDLLDGLVVRYKKKESQD